MANIYSDPYIFDRIAPVNPVNWDVAFKALEYRQGQYDANKLKYETMMQQFVSSDIIKKEVKDKFLNNIQGLVNEINAIGRTDFSDRGITGRLMGQISQALDPSTVNAIAVTREYRKTEAMLQELQLKHKDLYHVNNHQDMYRKKSSSGNSFEEWLSDGNPDSLYTGRFQYTPYTDYEREVNDSVMDLMKLNKDTKITLQDPTTPGRTIEKTIRGLTPEELRGIAENSLSADARQQIAIDARASYNWFESPEAITQIINDGNAYYQNIIKQVEEQEEKSKIRLAQSSEGSEEHRRLSTQLDILNRTKLNAEQTLSHLQKSSTFEDLSTHAARIRTEQFTQQVVDRYSPFYREITTGYGVDEYTKWITDVELSRLRLREPGSLSRTETRGEGDPRQGFTTIPSETPLEGREFDEEIVQRRDELQGIVTSSAIKMANHLEYVTNNPSEFTEKQIEEAESLNKLYNSRLQEVAGVLWNPDATIVEKINSFDPEGILMAELLSEVDGIKLLNSIDRDGESIVLEMLEAVDNYNDISSGLKRVIEESKEALKQQDQTALLQEVGTGQYQFFTADGQVLDLREELIKEGILDANGSPIPGAKLTNSKWAEDIERTFTAQQLGTYSGSLSYTIGELSFVSEIAESLGENINNIITPTEIPITPGGSVEGVSVNPDSKTGQFLRNVGTATQDRTWLGALTGAPKRSLAGDGRFANNYYLNKDYKDTQVYQDGIMRLYGKLETSNEIAVNIAEMPDGLMALIGRGNVVVDQGLGYSDHVYLRKINNNQIEVFQTQRLSSSPGDTVRRSVGIFNTHQLETAAPEVAAQINMDVKAKRYGYDSIGSTVQKSKPITFWGEDVSDTVLWHISAKHGTPADELKFKLPTAVEFIRQDPGVSGAMIYLRDSGVDPQLFAKIPTALEEASNFRIEARLQKDPRSNNYYTEVTVRDNGTNEEVYKDRYNEDNLDAIMFKIKHAPQTLYVDILKEVIVQNYTHVSNYIAQGYSPESVGNTKAYDKLININQ